MIVMGDMNARVGDDTGIWGEVLGRHGEEVCNENGRRLLQFSSEHNLCISTHGFHTIESTNTRGSVEVKGSGLSLTTSWWVRR